MTFQDSEKARQGRREETLRNYKAAIEGKMDELNRAVWHNSFLSKPLPNDRLVRSSNLPTTPNPFPKVPTLSIIATVTLGISDFVHRTPHYSYGLEYSRFRTCVDWPSGRSTVSHKTYISHRKSSSLQSIPLFQNHRTSLSPPWHTLSCLSLHPQPHSHRRFT